MHDLDRRGDLPRPVAPARTVVLPLAPPFDPAAVAALCARLDQLLTDHGIDQVVCDAGTLGRPDLGAIEAIARLQLVAVRRRRRLLVAHMSPALHELLSLAGLDAEIDPCPPEHGRPGQSSG